MAISEATYLQLIAEDPEHKWELRGGRLRSKEPLTWGHNHLTAELGFALRRQLDPKVRAVHVHAGRLQWTAQDYYAPDVIVIPMEVAYRSLSGPNALEVYREPLPLVVEVWSPSMGSDALAEKLPDYQQRGDHEIWLIHPFDCWLLASVQQPDGSYTDNRYDGGVLAPTHVPNVSIDLDALFDRVNCWP